MHLVLIKTGESNPYQVPLEKDQWGSLYAEWVRAVKRKWGDRGEPNNLKAEVFSPQTCAVFAVPGPAEEPIDFDGTRTQRDTQKTTMASALAKGPRPGQKRSQSTEPSETQRSQTIQWVTPASSETRGAGMNLIYSTPKSKLPRDYKGNPNVGGKAAAGPKSSFCSWVSIRRINEPHSTVDTECQEIVCLFLGKKERQEFNRDRVLFLKDLGKIKGSKNLFGVMSLESPPNSP